MVIQLNRDSQEQKNQIPFLVQTNGNYPGRSGNVFGL